jgi:phosphatidylinositol alpha-mannosyltransferase
VRVAVVCPYSFEAYGGVQDQVALLVGELDGAGLDAWAVAPGSGGPPGTRHVGRVTTVRANRSRAPITVSPVAMRRVRRAIADADVVHVHEPFMPVVSPAALWTAPGPVIGTFHADPGRVVRQVYRAAAPLLRRLARRLTAAVAVSPVAAAGVDRIVECREIPNGIDVAAYRPEGPPIAGRVLFLGRDEPRKGLGVLLDAWPRVRDAHPEAELRVIGARRPEPLPGVVYLGRVDEAAKRAELQRSAVVCAPNLGGESFGLVVAEAMAAGAAVVASDIPAFRAVLGEAGVLVTPGAPGPLADAVVRLLDDPDLAVRLGGAARRDAPRFDGAAVAHAYLELYREVLSR